MRRTKSQLKVAAALMANPDGRHYGYRLRVDTGTRSGVLYPLLRRFEEAGLIAGEWENFGRPGYPLRRYYTVTPAGRAALAEMLEEQSK